MPAGRAVRGSAQVVALRVAFASPTLSGQDGNFPRVQRDSTPPSDRGALLFLPPPRLVLPALLAQ